VGCADGTRVAFLDRTQFPDIAGCGLPVSYDQAAATSGSVCSPGWRWCLTTDDGGRPASPRPTAVAGATCGWLDNRALGCGDVFDIHQMSGCRGAVRQSASAGGSTTGLCTGVPTCTNAWKLIVPIDAWGAVSARTGASCREHVDFACAGTVGGAGCWVACCRGQ
jgi:hypothetical protein